MSRIQQAVAARMELVRKGEAEKGFTLIELLVVIIIIGILAAIAVPVFLNFRESAWKSSVESDVHNATLELERYAVENNGKYTDFGTTASVVSDGNTIEVDADATSYTITGSNENIADDEYVFDSTTGTGGWD